MSLKSFLEDVNVDVKDIINTKFEFSVTDASVVPSYEDSSLTFENGVTKKGKTIETCVLYVDIRDSVSLNNQHNKESMGKLYTAFTKAVLSIVDYHGGSVRNIIGDRVMAVFPPKNCFKSAVDCAISINTVATRVINKHFKLNEFKCGIGIDYGSMLVLKNGIIKQGHDRTAYKNLVWIGRPANIASRLTDVANKELNITRFKVYYNPYNFLSGMGSFSALFGGSGTSKTEPIYRDNIAVDDISDAEFVNKISWNETLKICYSGGRFIKFDKIEQKTKAAPILMTEEVFKGFKKDNPERNIKLWTEQKIEAKDYKGIVYGGDVYWKTIEEIKI